MTTKSILITVTISIIILKADLVTIIKSKSAITTLNNNRKNKKQLYNDNKAIL